MSDTDINATVNVTEDIYADVDSTAMSAAVIDDGDSIVVPAEVDFGQTLDTELEDNDLIDVPVDESVGIAGDHRVLLHRDAANQHPMSAITGLNETIAGINTALSDRITQVEAETADLDVDMASALLRIGDLQDQVDGNITTWFYAAEPAMNLPPVALDPSNPHDTGWNTIDKKNAHRGDLYYNTLTGYAYRFAYADGDFGWMRITDTDVVKALADAARAQDTADSKRRVFYTTPYPPYDKGDLWVQGTSGDILVCNTSKAVGEAYDFADWSRASKYTDDTVANLAMASANGKNTVYHQTSQPTGGTYKKGDTWFDTDDDYTMYTYDGSVWVKEQFGNEAIADLSITNGKIANATIEYGKIKSVDAGKITVGDLSANRIKASVITAVNGSTETSGGSSLKISADKVNIEGAAIFTSGRLSTTSLDNAYDANGAAADALSDAKDYADDTAADALADAKTYADGAVSDKAGKSDAVARQQRIYYRKTASGAPSKNTTWLTTSGTGYGNWSLKVPQMTNGTTKYPYLYTAIQTQTVSQKAAGSTCTCSDVLLDDTTTVIDGGTIITGTVNANAVNASSGTFNTANIPNLNASKITAGDISADRMKVNSISAINGNTGTVKISAGKVEIDGATTFTAIKSQTDAAYDSKGSASAVQTNLNNLEIGGRNLLKNSNDGSNYSWSQDGGARSKTVDESGATFTITELPVSGSWGVFMVSDASLRTNILAKETYTLSFDIKTSVAISYISFGFNVREGNGANPFLNDHAVVVSTTANTWVHIVNTTTAMDTLPSSSNSNLYITMPKLKNQLCSFSIKNVKVEKGNKATDWTPAPEDVQAEIDAKKSVHTLSTSYSYSYANLLTYSAEGYNGGAWTVSSTSGVKVGDTVRLKCTVSNMSNAPVYVVGTVTEVVNGTSLKMTSHGLDTTIIDGGNILTNSIGANQIAANAISIGKLDESTQEQITNRIKASDSKSGSIVTWENMLIDDLEVDIEPIQDLHGYDKPWSGGAGRNKYAVQIGRDSFLDRNSATHTRNNDVLTINATSTKNSGVVTASSATLQQLTASLSGTYTYSFDIKASVEGFIDIGFASAGSMSLGVVTGWHRVSITSSDFNATEKTFEVINGGDGSARTIQIRNFMIQEGSTATDYEPYSNICPISGYDSVVVNRCGKNLLDSSVLTTFGTTYISSINYNTQGKISVKPSTTYTISFASQVGDGRIFQYDASGNAIGSALQFTTKTYSFTTNEKCVSIGFRYKFAETTATVDDAKAQLELGSTATAYEPYQGNTYTTDLSGTRYGGTLDVVSGVLTVTHAIRTFDGTEDWKSPDGSGICWLRDDTLKRSIDYRKSIIASTMPSASNRYDLRDNYEFGIAGYDSTASGTDNYWYIKAPNQTTQTPTALKAWLQANNAQVCYELATPTTVQLTAQEVSALVGTNVLWANSGDVHVELTGVKDYADSISDAAKTATSYITDIDSNNGITIKAVNGATSGSDTTKQNYIKLNAGGLDIYQEGTSVAHYGDYARIGKDGEANTIISSDEVVISASDNINALRITPDGNVVTSDVTKLINHSFASGKTYTYEHPSSADANSLIRYRIKEKSSRYRTIEVRNGISTAETSITQPFSFKYSSTPTSITIKNTGTNTLTLERVVYKVTTISPLTKVGGVLVLGQNPDIESTTVIAVGNGSEEAPYSAFQVTKLGDIYIRGNCVNDFVIEEGEWDIWTYRKWHSGVAECWGTHTHTATHYAGPYASFLYGYNCLNLAFPSGLFVSGSRPCAVYGVKIGSAFSMAAANLSVTATGMNLYALSTASGSQSIMWDIHVKGKWK